MAKREAKTNEFPKMLYQFPSTSIVNAELQGGDKYDVLIVETVAEEEEAIADGWFLTSPEAKNTQVETVAEENKQDEVTGPPTRKELEQKAAELKIKFVAGTTDDALLKLIEAKAAWK